MGLANTPRLTKLGMQLHLINRNLIYKLNVTIYIYLCALSDDQISFSCFFLLPHLGLRPRFLVTLNLRVLFFFRQ